MKIVTGNLDGYNHIINNHLSGDEADRALRSAMDEHGLYDEDDE